MNALVERELLVLKALPGTSHVGRQPKASVDANNLNSNKVYLMLPGGRKKPHDSSMPAKSIAVHFSATIDNHLDAVLELKRQMRDILGDDVVAAAEELVRAGPGAAGSSSGSPRSSTAYSFKMCRGDGRVAKKRFSCWCPWCCLAHETGEGMDAAMLKSRSASASALTRFTEHTITCSSRAVRHGV